MHRRPLLSLLERHQAWDANERAAIEHTLAFVSRHANCFERTLVIGHVTGSAWVLDSERTHVLLTHHRKLDRWLQLGGHADGDPDVLGVARREAREESGLTALVVLDEAIFDVDVHRIPARGAEPEHRHYDVRFLLSAPREARITPTRESNDLAWVALDRVSSLDTDASVLRMVAKSRAGIR